MNYRRLLLCICYMPFVLCENNSDEIALWTQSITEHAEAQDYPYILSYYYWSYQRSQATLKVQQAFLKHVSTASDLGYQIARTRRNPSKQDTIETHFLVSAQTLQEAYTEYTNTNHIYSNFLEQLLRKYKDSELRTDIAELRSNVRTSIAQELLQQIPQLQQNLKDSQALLMNAAQHFGNLFFLKKNVRFLHYLWDYFPNLLMRSFVRFDDQCTQLQAGCHKSIEATHAFTNNVWNIIETQRSDCFKQLYNALQKTLIQKNSKTMRLITIEHNELCETERELPDTL